MEFRGTSAWAGLLALAFAVPLSATTPPQTPAPAPNPAPAGAFVIDPGHGGDDLGAVVRGKMEKDITLAVALKVKENLERLGAGPVRLTRDSDVYVPLDQRVDESLALPDAAFVSLHVNQVRSKKPSGITVYEFGRHLHFGFRRRFRHHRRPRRLGRPPRRELRESEALADAIARSLHSQGFAVGAPERAEYYVLKNPRLPSVLIEMGFLSNPEEAARLADPAYQEKLASAIAESLRSYEADARREPPAARLARKP